MAEKSAVRPYTRKGPDLIVRMVDLSSIILWGFLIINFSIIISAKPVGMTFFDRLLNISVRDYWDFTLLQFALFLSFAQFAVSLFSLFLNSRRLKRKDDRIKLSIVISIFASLILCVLLALIFIF